MVMAGHRPPQQTHPRPPSGGRNNEDAYALLHHLKLALKPGWVPLFLSDGLRSYFYAITAHFGCWFRPERARTDHWHISDHLLYGQLVKQRKSRKSGFAIMRMMAGKRKDLNVLLQLHGFAQLIQTAFIERVNLTIRRGVAPLMRKIWSLAQNPDHLLLHVEWWLLLSFHPSSRVAISAYPRIAQISAAFSCPSCQSGQ